MQALPLSVLCTQVPGGLYCTCRADKVLTELCPFCFSKQPDPILYSLCPSSQEHGRFDLLNDFTSLDIRMVPLVAIGSPAAGSSSGSFAIPQRARQFQVGWVGPSKCN